MMRICFISVSAILMFGFSFQAAAWTDDPLLVDSPMKVQHIIELRAAIDASRADCSLPAATWRPLVAGTPVLADDINDLRNAISSAYAKVSKRVSFQTDPTITADKTIIRAAHINELRAVVTNAATMCEPVARQCLSADKDQTYATKLYQGRGCGIPLVITEPREPYRFPYAHKNYTTRNEPAPRGETPASIYAKNLADCIATPLKGTQNICENGSFPICDPNCRSRTLDIRPVPGSCHQGTAYKCYIAVTGP